MKSSRQCLNLASKQDYHQVITAHSSAALVRASVPCQECVSGPLTCAGRCSNLVVMAHSSAALFGAPLAAAKAGALIFLGSYFFPSPDYHASLYEWSR